MGTQAFIDIDGFGKLQVNNQNDRIIYPIMYALNSHSFIHLLQLQIKWQQSIQKTVCLLNCSRRVQHT